MKYSSYIDNITAIEWGMDIKLAYLFDWIYTLPSWAECITTTEGGNFYFASKKKACEELPLLTDKVDTMYRHYKGLEEMGLIVLIKVGNKDYIQLTNKAKEWGKSSEHSEKNPRKVGKKSKNSSENDPTYKNTINDKNTTDHSLETQKFIEAKKLLFKETIVPHVEQFGRDMCNRFYRFWSEVDKSGKKLRWEREDTWEIKLRMIRWKEKDDEKKSSYQRGPKETPNAISHPENLRNGPK